MSQDPESGSKGWWQTLPGLLTAGAAIITALGGLLVAIHQTGFFDRSTQPPALTQGKSLPTGAGSVAAPVTAGDTASRPITLPTNIEVRSGQSVYKLLSARLDPYSSDKVSVYFSVRMTNNSRFPVNFWSDSFRLSVDGSLQAPINFLNEIVSSNNVMDGDLEFVIPASASTVGLQMGDVGEDKPTIPIDLRVPQR
jgi:hypothetical protein